ncbi:MAG: trimethylamine methyltransferase family protein [Armatimonadetes bacterium]|nr:trimethylamine methyltransferase family protein [Armatimonadota bacterium]
MVTTILSESQIARIDAAARTILERTGVEVPHDELLARLADSGAAVDFARRRVRLPGDLVDHCLATAGRQYTLYGRDTRRQARFGVGERNYNSIHGEAHWTERIGGPRRPCTLADVATAARFGDGLERLTIVGAMSDPHELPAAWRCVAVMAELLAGTTKPIGFWYHDRASARFCNELLIALRGDVETARRYPVCGPFLEPISPLRFPFHGLDLLFETARLDLPVAVGPMAQMGLSAPMSLAGTMALEHAEILAGICLTQMVKPGLAVCYGGICHAFDMRTTQMIFAGPEQAIFGVAMTQLGRHLGLPVYINVGLTDSKRPDAQAGLECGATLLAGAAAGADIFGHLGICGVDQATSLEMLCWQHEVVGYVESCLRAVDLDDDALALDLVDSLGPGGRFIDTDHTAARFRREQWFPTVLDREFHQAWLDDGARSTEDAAKRNLV